jgi:hypothetical protein
MALHFLTMNGKEITSAAKRVSPHTARFITIKPGLTRNARWRCHPHKWLYVAGCEGILQTQMTASQNILLVTTTWKEPQYYTWTSLRQSDLTIYCWAKRGRYNICPETNEPPTAKVTQQIT